MIHGQSRTPERLVELNHRAAPGRMTHLSEQAAQAAVQEERIRIAREIHDTLAQAFTGILLQLGAPELPRSDSSAQERALLESVRDLAREGLAEARRSVQPSRGLHPTNVLLQLYALVHGGCARRG